MPKCLPGVLVVVLLLLLLLIGVGVGLWQAAPPPLPSPHLHWRLPPHPNYPETPLHHVYAFPLLPPEEASSYVDAMETYAAQNGGWTTKRHDAYPTTDIPVKNTPLAGKISAMVRDRVFPILSKVYGFKTKYLSIRDLFFVKYEAGEGQNSLEFHRDGSLLSFNILCNRSSEFDGGGTLFEALGDRPVEPSCGDLVVHSGKLRHSGRAITRGKRYLLVGFVNVSDPAINHNLLQRYRTSVSNIELDYMLSTNVVQLS